MEFKLGSHTIKTTRLSLAIVASIIVLTVAGVAAAVSPGPVQTSSVNMGTQTNTATVGITTTVNGTVVIQPVEYITTTTLTTNATTTVWTTTTTTTTTITLP